MKIIFIIIDSIQTKIKIGSLTAKKLAERKGQKIKEYNETEEAIPDKPSRTEVLIS